jgi:hypothetical protein
MDNLKKYRRVQDLIEKKEDVKARSELQKIIRNHPKMKAYKKQLSDMGLDLKEVDVPELVFEKVQDVLKEYDTPVKLKIIDIVYKQIATKGKNDK